MSTKVVLLRHAKPLTEGYADDLLRPLSQEGIEKQILLAEQLRKEEIIPTFILTSPILRAIETAEIVGRAFAMDAIEEAVLGEAYDSQSLYDKTLAYPPGSTLFLIGHAPSLEHFLSVLTNGASISGGLSKSSAAIIEFQSRITSGKGRLIRYIKL